jgi:hypothetical protein
VRAFILPFLFAVLAGHSVRLPAEEAPPTCALIVEGSSALKGAPVAALLEADLVQSGTVRLVERGEIERLVREQEIGLLFSPESGGNRSALGKLLKADLLVVLRLDRSRRPQEQIDVVVCETNKGLRLWTSSIPRSADPQAAVLMVKRPIAEAAKRIFEPHLRVFAVPPFVSHNLRRDFDHLQVGFARLVEEILGRQEGIAVVELAEAQAITRELSLTGGAAEDRRLPFFIMGEFRHDGVKDACRITVSVSLKYKDQLLDRLTRSDLTLGEAPIALAGMVAKLLNKTDVKLRDVNPAEEAQTLAERAEEFLRIGNWNEALGLLEASLLLDADQPRLHTAAARLYLDRISEEMAAERNNEYVAVNLPRMRAALTHLEAAIFADHVESLGESLSLLLNRASLSCDGAEESLAESCRQLREQQRDIAVRFLEHNLASGRRVNCPSPGNWDYVGTSIADRYEIRLRVLQVFPFTLDLLMCHGNRFHTELQQAHTRFLEKASEMPDPEVATAARRELTAWKTSIANAQSGSRVSGSSPAASRAKQSFPRSATPASEAEADVVFRPISLTCRDAFLLDIERPPRPGAVGWTACGPGLDLVWTACDVFFMSEKGRLDRVIALPSSARLGAGDVCWDGQYAWVAREGEDSRLHVVDASNYKVRMVSGEDGLPTMQRSLVLPVRPGQVCVLGSFELDPRTHDATRSWCALVSIENAVPSVDVFQESRLNDWFEPQATHAFPPRDEPDYASNLLAGFVLDRGTGGVADLLVLRTRRIGSVVSPFVIKPAERAIELGDASRFGADAVRAGGYLYWPCRGGKARGFLHRTHLGTLECENLGVKYPDTWGMLAAAGENLYWCGRELWRWRNGQKDFERVRIFPSLEGLHWRFHESSHYGVILPKLQQVYQVDERRGH